MRVDAIVLKVAARCNIDCDYCYVFKHADQSFKKQPRLLNMSLIKAFAHQVDTYLSVTGQPEISICFHGGEPLLGGISYFQKMMLVFKETMSNFEKVLWGIQTNGVLLTRDFLKLFRSYRIQVSISLDGPQAANDKHRLDHRGLSTYEKVSKALYLLRTEYRDLFRGIISVIDPTNDPKEILDFFAEINPPSYNFLLPDANHCVLPPGRKQDSDLYLRWLEQALTYWYQKHQKLRLRTFLNLFDGLMGKPTESEFFGNGAVSYLIVETDGSYHYSDILKSSYEGASNLGLSVATSTFEEVMRSSAIQKYEAMLKLANKCSTCLRCSEVTLCGGGNIAHRYGLNGFDNPSVYCRELLALIQLGRRLITCAQIEEVAAQPYLNEKRLLEFFLSPDAYLLINHLSPSDRKIENSFLKTSQGLGLLLSVFPEMKNEAEQQIVGQEERLPLEEAEQIMSLLLKKRLKIFHRQYPLTSSTLDWNRLLHLYLLCYRFRLGQQLSNIDYEEYHVYAINNRKKLLEALANSDFFLLSTIGTVFLNQLVEEFHLDPRI